jgi:hypothetical protein
MMTSKCGPRPPRVDEEQLAQRQKQERLAAVAATGRPDHRMHILLLNADWILDTEFAIGL